MPGTERPVAPATINRELAQLRRMLRLAYRRRKLAYVPSITMLPESEPRQGFIEEPAFRTIVQNLEPGQALAATIAFETAWRIRSEVLTLEWSRVDVVEGCIRLDGEHSKNGKPRTAYLSPATTALLAQQRERVVALGSQINRIIPDVFVHTGKGPLQGQRVREFNKAWRSACDQAGYNGVLLHDLRRSGVRAMVRAGVPESVAQRISGHATAAVSRRYDITSDQDLRDARDRRAQFGHNQAAKVVALGNQLNRIIPDVFVHTGKGPLQGCRVREFNKAWRSACDQAGYTGVLLHDLRRSGVRAMVRAGVPESVAQRISGHATAAVFRRYDITSDQDLRDARDRRAQFGHNQAAKVVSLNRQVAN